MNVAPQSREVPESSTAVRVTYAGSEYPAEVLTRGAAYEIFSSHPEPGFERDSRPQARFPWHRFVHASDIGTVRRSDGGPAGPSGGGGPAGGVVDPPLLAPLGRARSWEEIHQLSQSPIAAGDPLLTGVRESAAIAPGTSMVKVLSPRQLAGHVHGRLPYGFCYREYDVAHLRTPGALALLRTDTDSGHESTDVAFALRWRAVAGFDYVAPVGEAFRGLITMPPHDRIGPPVLGTGFSPSGQHLIPEFVTRDLADLPMPVNAALLAYPGDGEEVVLYTYQPEQRGWLRMVGPRWRHLLAAVPGISPEQEYVPVGEDQRSTHLLGDYQQQEYEAVADPPDGYRVLAMTRAARYPVTRLRRRARYATWRGASCLVVREEGGWLRLRLCQPDPESVSALGAQCYERGVYEAWAPAVDVTDDRLIDVVYHP